MADTEKLTQQIRRNAEMMERLRRTEQDLKKRLSEQKRKEKESWQTELLKKIDYELLASVDKEYWELVSPDDIVRMISGKKDGQRLSIEDDAGEEK